MTGRERVALANFKSVLTLGNCAPLSRRAIADCVVPMRSANSAWVSPARTLALISSRARLNSSAIASYAARTSRSSIIFLLMVRKRFVTNRSPSSASDPTQLPGAASFASFSRRHEAQPTSAPMPPHISPEHRPLHSIFAIWTPDRDAARRSSAGATRNFARPTFSPLRSGRGSLEWIRACGSAEERMESEAEPRRKKIDRTHLTAL